METKIRAERNRTLTLKSESVLNLMENLISIENLKNGSTAVNNTIQGYADGVFWERNSLK